MKKVSFFFFLWVLGIFFQSFFDIVVSFWKINVFFCIVYSVIVLFRSPIFAIYSFFLGLTYDYLNFSSPGIYALSFFLAFYIFYFFDTREGELLKQFFLSIFIFCCIHLFVILLNFIFNQQNYLGLFFTSTILKEAIPTTILLLGVYPLITLITHKLKID